MVTLALSALQEDEAKELVKNAIKAGIFNDLGSGSNVDLCVIRDVIASSNCCLAKTALLTAACLPSTERFLGIASGLPSQHRNSQRGLRAAEGGQAPRPHRDA